MVDFAGIGAVISGVGGLFGKKGHDAGGNSSLGIRGQAHGARMAAKEYGFNPLTLLQASSPLPGDNWGAAPPLASAAVIGEGLDRMFGEGAKDAEQARVHNRLQNELLQVELDRARGAVYVQPPRSAVAGAGAGTPALNGGRASVYGQPTSYVRPSPTFGAPGYDDRSGLTPEREVLVKPTEDISGIIEVNNAITGPVSFAGADGEIFMEYLQIPLVGVPQVAGNWADRAGQWWWDNVSKPFGASADSWFSGKPPVGHRGYQP